MNTTTLNVHFIPTRIEVEGIIYITDEKGHVISTQTEKFNYQPKSCKLGLED